ncbi:bacterial alpha-L-rhamnosidase-domain-containing protein [Mycena amicta]|nr:bacterial alpha-L-rhamnosidase-domain-containing protein [Mycena amicta]
MDAFTTGASWIWTASPGQIPPIAPVGDIALRLTYAVPSGLTAVNATILATADDLFTLYANGVVVGSAPNVVDIWRNAQIFRDVPLTAASESLVFAIRATNAGAQANPAGVLFAALVLLSDSSSVLLTSSTSSSWKATTSIPADFELPSTSDSSWDAPISLGTYGVSPWDTNVVVAPRTTPVPSLSTASWIWNDPDAAASTAADDVLFRRTFPLTTSNKSPVSAQIVLTADNLFVLWVNGVQVGAAPNDPNGWQVAETIPVSLAAGAQTVAFAVQATNIDVGPAGLLLSALVLYSDGSSDALVSDADWKTLAPGAPIPDNWQSPNFDDADWNAANVLGKYGVAPWDNQVGVPDPLGEHPAPLLRKGFVLDGANGGASLFFFFFLFFFFLFFFFLFFFFFSNPFFLGKEIAQARVIYAAGGYAAITLNGQPISDRVLTPGFTKYDTRMQYVVVDVKGLLAGGSAPNVLAAELGRSHYGVTQGSGANWAGAPWHGEPVLRLVLSVVYTDGTRERVVSDGSWRNVEGPTRLDDIFGGENYDASYEIPGWNLPTFDDSAWNTALVALAPKGTLVHASQPPTRLIASLTPVNITQPVPGQFVAAFERVVAGWVKLSVTGAKGSLVTIHYGEKLNPDGTVIYQDPSHSYANNFQTDRYWLAGTGTAEVFEPKFSYKGYQYIQISGWPAGSSPPTPADIIGQVVHDDLAPAGDFACSVDLLNQLHIASVRTMLNNVHSIPTDCPTFEKNGWSGDAQLSTEMLLMNFDSQGLLNKYTQDLQDSIPAGGNGSPGVYVPNANGNVDQAPPWHAALILIPAWLYSYRGDLRALSDNYAGMKAYIEFELGRSPNNLANTIFGDWLAPDAPNGNPAEDTRVPATAYLYHMLDVMSTVATTLGNTADAATFASQAASVKRSFNTAFFNASLGHYAGNGDADYRQSHNLLALAFNLTTDAVQAQTVADGVVADVNGARGGHLNTGALSTKHILPVLTKYGYPDVALAVAQQTTYPSWGFWIENGGTSLWEGWWVDARSHDHMFLGTFEDWYYKSVLGIQATSTAFKTVSIAPLFTSSIPSASGWLLTPFGNLTISYTITGAALALDVTLPVGVSAVVSFASGARSLSEGGKPVAQAKGVTVVSSSGNAPMQVQVGSGKYSFVAK